MKSLTLIISFITFSINLFAQDNLSIEDNKSLKINEIQIQEVETSPELSRKLEVGSLKNVGEIVMTANRLIALGKKIWKIVESGKPVVNMTSMQAVSVLPNQEESEQPLDTFDLSHWSAPEVKSYQVNFKNGWGSSVIQMTYNVIFQYGGRYQGEGRYLTGVNVVASDVSVGWGFEFDAVTKLENISNVGSKENPVSSAIISIEYTGKSTVSNISSKESFYITGEGEMRKLY